MRQRDLREMLRHLALKARAQHLADAAVGAAKQQHRCRSVDMFL
jgi:hypothetical protein